MAFIKTAASPFRLLRTLRRLNISESCFFMPLIVYLSSTACIRPKVNVKNTGSAIASIEALYPLMRDLNEIYINCNESFARQIMGLPKAEVIGGSFREFQKRVPKELAEIYHKHDRSLLEKGGSNYYETKVLCADGIERDFLYLHNC